MYEDCVSDLCQSFWIKCYTLLLIKLPSLHGLIVVLYYSICLLESSSWNAAKNCLIFPSLPSFFNPFITFFCNSNRVQFSHILIFDFFLVSYVLSCLNPAPFKCSLWFFALYIFFMELTSIFTKPASAILFEIVLPQVITYLSKKKGNEKKFIILFLVKYACRVNKTPHQEDF